MRSAVPQPSYIPKPADTLSEPDKAGTSDTQPRSIIRLHLYEGMHRRYGWYIVMADKVNPERDDVLAHNITLETARMLLRNYRQELNGER
jgi:hypothetical protein